MAKRECEECKKVFEYTPPANYPDKRKYCDDCSAKRKAEYAASTGSAQPQKSAQSDSKQEIQTSRHDVVVSRVEKPHSFEFGKASARHKIYYGEISELKAHIQALKDAGFHEEMGMDVPIEKS